MRKDKFISWDEDKQYSLVRGGLIDSIYDKLRFLQKGKLSELHRAIFWTVLTWFPLLLLSSIYGTFSGGEGKIGFIQDFSVHIRLLVVVPFLIWIEKLIEPAFDGYMNSTRRLIPGKEEDKFGQVVIMTAKLANSWLPELLFLVLIYGSFIASWESLTLRETAWAVAEHGAKINLAGLYYLVISVPVYQFLLVRWFWRWIVWAFTAIKFSRMNLQIEASHADQMAGLEYLSLVPKAFCVMCLSVSTVFSALIAEDTIHHGTALSKFPFAITIFVIAIPVIIHLPLLAFTPLLIRTKARAIIRFGSLIQYHNNLFNEKWMEGNLPDNETILPSLDNSSMADLNGSYQQAVQRMNLIPVSKQSIIYLAVLLLVPFLPLVFTMYSMSELFSKLAQIVTG